MSGQFTIRFDAEIILTGDRAPDRVDGRIFSYAEMQQAVQDAIGHTGAIVLDVTEYTEDS